MAANSGTGALISGGGTSIISATTQPNPTLTTSSVSLQPCQLPENFGIVQASHLDSASTLYRCAAPLSSTFLTNGQAAWVKSLGLKSILLLTPELPPRPVLNWYDEMGISLYHLGSSSWPSPMPSHISTSTTANPLSNPTSLPVNSSGMNNTTPGHYFFSIPPAPPPSSSWKPISEEMIKEGLEFLLNASHYPVMVQCTSGLFETGMLVGCLRKLQNWNFGAIVIEYRSYAGSKSRYINEQFIELFDLDLVNLPNPTQLLVPCVDVKMHVIDLQRQLAVQSTTEVDVMQEALSHLNQCALNILQGQVDASASFEAVLVGGFLKASPRAEELFAAWEFQYLNNITKMDVLVMDTMANVIQVSKLLLQGSKTVGSTMIHLIITTAMKSIYRGLSSGKGPLILACLNLLRVIAGFSSSAAKELFASFNFSLKGLPKFSTLTLPASKVAIAMGNTSIATAYTRFILNFLVRGDAALKKALFATTTSTSHDLFSGILRSLGKETPATVIMVLNVLREHIILDAQLGRGVKASFFTPWVLEQIAQLYHREEPCQIDVIESGVAGTRTSTMREQVHTFLSRLCGNAGGEEGAVFSTKHSGWYSKSHAKILLKFIGTLQVTDDSLQQQLCLGILDTFPELVEPYLVTIIAHQLSFEARASEKWILNMAFVLRILELNVPSGLGVMDGEAPSDPPALTVVVENILPGLFSRATLGKGLQNAQKLVKYYSAMFLCKCFKRLSKVVQEIDILSSSPSKIDWSSFRGQVIDAFGQRLPDFQVILGLLHFCLADLTAELPSEENDGRPSSLMLSLMLDLLNYYQIYFPILVGESRFDHGKLLTTISDGTLPFSVPVQRRVLENVIALPEFKFWQTNDKKQSHFKTIVLTLRTAKDEDLKNVAVRALEHSLATNFLFQGYPHELRYWFTPLLQIQNDEAFACALNFMDEAFAIANRNSFKVIDKMNTFIAQVNVTLSESSKRMFEHQVSTSVALMRNSEGGQQSYPFSLGVIAIMDGLVAAEKRNVQHLNTLQSFIGAVLQGILKHTQSCVEFVESIRSYGGQDRKVFQTLFSESLIPKDNLVLHSIAVFQPSVDPALFFGSEIDFRGAVSHLLLVLTLLADKSLKASSDISALFSALNRLLTWSSNVSVKLYAKLKRMVFEHPVVLGSFLSKSCPFAWDVSMLLYNAMTIKSSEVDHVWSVGYLHRLRDAILYSNDVQGSSLDFVKLFQMFGPFLSIEIKDQIMKHILSTDLLSAPLRKILPMTISVLSASEETTSRRISLSSFERLLKLSQKSFISDFTPLISAALLSSMSISSGPAIPLEVVIDSTPVYDESTFLFADLAHSFGWSYMSTYLTNATHLDTNQDLVFELLIKKSVAHRLRLCNEILDNHDIFNGRKSLQLIVLAALLDVGARELTDEQGMRKLWSWNASASKVEKKAIKKIYSSVRDELFEQLRTGFPCGFYRSVTRILIQAVDLELENNFELSRADVDALDTESFGQSDFVEALLYDARSTSLAPSIINVMLYLGLKACISCISRVKRSVADESFDRLMNAFKSFLDTVQRRPRRIQFDSSLASNDFIKSALKYRIEDGVTISALCSLVQTLYPPKVSDEWMPLSEILSMILGHSKFQIIMSADETAHSGVKVHLCQVIQSIFSADKSLLSGEYLGQLIPMYGATQSQSDRALRDIMNAHEIHGCSVMGYVNHYFRSAGGLVNALVTLDPKIMLKSCREFGYDDDPSNFDPEFLLPALAAVLCLNYETLDAKQLLDSNILGLAIMALADEDEHTRSTGYFIMDRAYLFLDASMIKERNQIMLVLESFRNAIVDRSQKHLPQIPRIMAVFIAQSLEVMAKPETLMYPMLNRFYLQRAVLDLGDVPMFYDMFYSSSDNARSDRLWMLRLLSYGVRNAVDYKLFKRRHVFDLLASFFHTSMADFQTQRIILDMVGRMAQDPSVLCDMIQNAGLVSFMNAVLATFPYQPKNTLTIGIPRLLNVIFDGYLQIDRSWLGKTGKDVWIQEFASLFLQFIVDIRSALHNGISSAEESLYWVNVCSDSLRFATRILSASKKLKVQVTLPIDFAAIWDVIKMLQLCENWLSGNSTTVSMHRDSKEDGKRSTFDTQLRASSLAHERNTCRDLILSTICELPHILKSQSLSSTANTPNMFLRVLSWSIGYWEGNGPLTTTSYALLKTYLRWLLRIQLENDGQFCALICAIHLAEKENVLGRFVRLLSGIPHRLLLVDTKNNVKIGPHPELVRLFVAHMAVMVRDMSGLRVLRFSQTDRSTLLTTTLPELFANAPGPDEALEDVVDNETPCLTLEEEWIGFFLHLIVARPDEPLSSDSVLNDVLANPKRFALPV